MPLAGKVALLTGIDSDVGAAIACRFVGEGAQVAGIRGLGAHTGSTTLPSELLALEGEVWVRADAERMVAEIEDRFGRLDALVNFGAFRRVIGTVMEVTDEDFREEMQADLRSVMVLSAAAISLMERSGGGAILNIASIAAAGLKGRALRSSSKAALAALTRAMAQDHGEQGIRVNALLLGPTQTPTPANRAATPGIPERGGLLGYDASPDDVAAAAYFLISNESRSITGALLPVDAGRSLPTF